jgi:hypothetical protein
VWTSPSAFNLPDPPAPCGQRQPIRPDSDRRDPAHSRQERWTPVGRERRIKLIPAYNHPWRARDLSGEKNYREKEKNEEGHGPGQEVQAFRFRNNTKAA